MEIKQVIKMYLDCMAQQDSEFAGFYANKDKNLDECLLYIQATMYEKAKKEAEDGKKQAVCLAPSDDEIFSLAVRYYYDTDLKVEGTSFDNVKILSMAATSFTEEEKQKMREDAIKEYQQQVIAEQKKKDQERKEKKAKEKKPAAPILVPDDKKESEQPQGNNHQAQQLSLF